MDVDQERERLVAILRDLDLPPGGFCLSGSAVLVLHGIQRSKEMGDLDIFIPTRTWFQLYESGEWSLWTTDPEDPTRRHDPPYLIREVRGLEVNVFSEWRKRGVGDIDVAFWTCNSELVKGWPCVRLEFVLNWKEAVGRDKDLDDIKLLRQYLRTDGRAA